LYSPTNCIYNAKIFTADHQKPFAETIAINGKMITAVGNYNEVRQKQELLQS